MGSGSGPPRSLSLVSGWTGRTGWRGSVMKRGPDVLEAGEERRGQSVPRLWACLFPHFSSSRVPHVHLQPRSDDHRSPASAGRPSGSHSGLAHGAGRRVGSRSHGEASRDWPMRPRDVKLRKGKHEYARTRALAHSRTIQGSGFRAHGPCTTITHPYPSIPSPGTGQLWHTPTHLHFIALHSYIDSRVALFPPLHTRLDPPSDSSTPLALSLRPSSFDYLYPLHSR